MREHAHYFRVSCRERENLGLAGGETVHTKPRAPISWITDAPLGWLIERNHEVSKTARG
jgi:hypothetical protein